MPSTTKIMEATNKPAECFYSLEEFKTLVVGNPDARLDIFHSKPEEGKDKAPFWFSCGGIRGTVSRKCDPTTVTIARIAQFDDGLDEQGNPVKSYCFMQGAEPVVSF